MSRGQIWLDALASPTASAQQIATGEASIQARTATLGNSKAHFISVVPDPECRFVRAREGQVGLSQGWTLAKVIRDLAFVEAGQNNKTPIIAIVDVPSQAYGRLEEQLGINWACAAAANAYAQARRYRLESQD